MLDVRAGAENHVGRALTYASETVLQPSGGQAARENVAKVVIVVLGSASKDSVMAAARRLLTTPYLVTLAVGHSNALQVRPK